MKKEQRGVEDTMIGSEDNTARQWYYDLGQFPTDKNPIRTHSHLIHIHLDEHGVAVACA